MCSWVIDFIFFARYHSHGQTDCLEHSMNTSALLATLLLVISNKSPNDVKQKTVQTLNTMVQLVTKGLSPLQQGVYRCSLSLQMGNGMVLQLASDLTDSCSIDLTVWTAQCSGFRSAWKSFVAEMRKMEVGLEGSEV